MMRKILLITLLLLGACEKSPTNAQNVAPIGTRANSDVCISERNDPNRLDQLLECIIRNHLHEMMSADGTPLSAFGDYAAACRFLPAAVKIIQSDHHNEVKDDILAIHMEQSLPLKDYAATWAPAAKVAFSKGFITERILKSVLFPGIVQRADLYLAYETLEVRQLYASIPNDKLIAGLKGGPFFEWRTAEENAKAIASGDAARLLQSLVKAGRMNGKPREVDLTTSCSTVLKGE